jgi:hypothetical protein
MRVYEDEIRSVEGPDAGRSGPEGTALLQRTLESTRYYTPFELRACRRQGSGDVALVLCVASAMRVAEAACAAGRTDVEDDVVRSLRITAHAGGDIIQLQQVPVIRKNGRFGFEAFRPGVITP